ncbi:MAG: biosynthetic arginine decarboxylase [Verrucomicrobia bacterium]|nr:biosynthetic arginine decarboxylase [Verrucomicrobiota bacterium]MDA1065179.1 biosynthetic arginine decarboxylase [Verrucomicrobiota bacterium]
MQNWSYKKSETLYGFDRWGNGYFSVDESGEVTVTPIADGPSIRITEAMEEAFSRGLKPPLLLRFQDILRDRVEAINQAFVTAIEQESYAGKYQGVFPVKVNQLREVVEEILEAGQPYNFGLEAGSKPELILAMAYIEDSKRLLICNGYKDETYLNLALMAQKLGKNVIIVIEQLDELQSLIKLARKSEIVPSIGIRIKLQSQGEGKWATSSGEKAKFGLTTPEVIAATRQLEEAGLTNALKLVHFHIGSQVPNILTIKNAVTEATRFYCELKKRGFPMGYLDVGGGLGIDYDGSRTNFDSSMNYTMSIYARDVVFNIQSVCQQSQVPVPDIISESGRAIVAPHSVLILEVFNRITRHEHRTSITPKTKSKHKIIEDLEYSLNNESDQTPLERYHDALQKRDEAFSLFNLGYLDLDTRAEAESIYCKICKEVVADIPKKGYQHEELMELRSSMVDQYVCNFSVFQSLLDHWALNQLFPVAPIHRHLEKPTVDAIIVDITCDSDGKISKFIDLEDELTDILPLHPLSDKPYYLGIFLLGAYQDIMGDMHNLFSKVPEAHVFLEDDEEDGFYIEEIIPGASNKDVLELTQYHSHDLTRKIKKQIDKATKSDKIRPREGMQLLNFYQKTLENTMYLEFE